jgi:hypothetical protein
MMIETNEKEIAMDEETKQLLKDLYGELFNLNVLDKKNFRVPCNCPPGKPIYNSRKEVIDVEPSFSCAFCRLANVVDGIYGEEAANAHVDDENVPAAAGHGYGY